MIFVVMGFPQWTVPRVSFMAVLTKGRLSVDGVFDIFVCVQELVLLKQECHILNTFHGDFYGYGVSPVDSSKVKT